MKYILFLLIIPFFSLAQKHVFADSFLMNRSFKEQVHHGMSVYHNKFRGNDLYNFNVSKKPVFESADTIIYKVKFITNANGYLLWDGKAVFTQIDNKIYCQLSELKMIKRTAMMKSPEYLNISLDDMENTKGNRMNMEAINIEVSKFFKYFK